MVDCRIDACRVSLGRWRGVNKLFCTRHLERESSAGSVCPSVFRASFFRRLLIPPFSISHSSTASERNTQLPQMPALETLRCAFYDVGAQGWVGGSFFPLSLGDSHLAPLAKCRQRKRLSLFIDRAKIEKEMQDTERTSYAWKRAIENLSLSCYRIAHCPSLPWSIPFPALTLSADD